MAAIDIDRDAARDAAQHELAKAIYPKPPLTEQIAVWIERLLYRITAASASVPGGWFTITILLILLTVAIVVAVRIARRAMRTSERGSEALFGSHDLSAAEHRATARRHAAAGDWAPAIRHRLRAVARQLEEDGVLDPAPGRTATELAAAAGRALPPLADRFAAAAECFNGVSYGERPGTEDQYRMIEELDDELGRHPAAPPADTVREGPPQAWAEVG